MESRRIRRQAGAWVMVWLTLLAVSAHGAAMNRCTMPDGRIIYSDIACPPDARAATVTAPTTTQPAPRPAAPARPPPPPATIDPRPLPPPVRVEFTGVPEVDYVKAQARLDNIRSLGWDCQWALKVDRSRLAVCRTFLEKLRSGGEYDQVTKRVMALNEDPKNMRASEAEVRKIYGLVKEIVRYKEFVIANLQSASP